jgi:hypothetical protein
VPANADRGSDDNSLATLQQCMGRCGVKQGGCRPIQKSKLKNPRPVSRRGLNSCDDEDMPVICPTCQILLERPPIFIAGNSLSRIPAPVARSFYRQRLPEFFRVAAR